MSGGALVRQFGCVAIGGRGLLIDGPPGSGKSALALRSLTGARSWWVTTG